MVTYKCDACLEEIKKDEEHINVSIGRVFGGFLFCKNCGKPVIEFLTAQNLVGKK